MRRDEGYLVNAFSRINFTAELTRQLCCISLAAQQFIICDDRISPVTWNEISTCNPNSRNANCCISFHIFNH